MNTPLVRIAAILAGVAGANLFVGCAKDQPVGPTGYIVNYRLASTGGLTIDSVKYDDGHGTMVRVLVPASGWSVVQSVALGGSVEAICWGVGAPSSSATLKAIWTANGFSSQADSSTVVTASSSHFALDVPHRKI